MESNQIETRRLLFPNFEVLDFSNLNHISEILLFGFMCNSSIIIQFSFMQLLYSSLKSTGQLSNYPFRWDKAPILALLRLQMEIKCW